MGSRGAGRGAKSSDWMGGSRTPVGDKERRRRDEEGAGTAGGERERRWRGNAGSVLRGDGLWVLADMAREGIVIVVVVVVVVVVEQKPGIFPNKSGRPAATKSKRRKRQETRANPNLGTNSYRTTMAQGTSKLAEKQKRANKKTQNMKKGKRVVPPKKTAAVKQQRATKVRWRDEGGDRC
jgi:flagellar hook-basal body complex protein FliE